MCYPAAGLSVPSCGAIPSKQIDTDLVSERLVTFSPLMRGNPIETMRARHRVVPTCHFQSPHAGQSHRNLHCWYVRRGRLLQLSVPSCGAIPSKHDEVYVPVPELPDLSVPSCGAIPSKPLYC